MTKICKNAPPPWRMHGGNGLNFGMLMYPDHLQNLLNFVHGLLIFLFLASFWLSETGQIWGLCQFSSECMGGMACNLTWWCILTTFSTAYILVMVCGFSSFWREFDLVKQVKFAVFRHFLENALQELAELILWYSKKWKWQISAYKNYPVTQLGVSLTAV